VEAFYTRIRHGRAPSAEQLADLKRRYDAIGGTSPLAERTAAQVAGVAGELERRAPGRFEVAFGAKYAAPLIEDAARALVDAGTSCVVGLVLAPHESSLSTAQYMDRARSALGDGVDFRAIGAWWSQPQFVLNIARRVEGELATIPVERHATTTVIFSAHSLPSRIVDAGDTYAEQLTASAELVANAIDLPRHLTAWQSAGRTEEAWLGPDLLTVLRNERATGTTDVVVCPIGFVSDHLEVLYDIDVEAQVLAEQIGLHLQRTSSLNDDPEFTAMLASLVLGQL